MLTPDQEKLKEAALAASPGPWTWWTSNSNTRLTGADGKDGGVLCGTAHRGYGDIMCSAEDREHIALANPAVILAILAQLEQVQRDAVEEFAEPEYELWQDGFVVAGTAGKGALKEAKHYAAVYSQDGPVEIVEVTRRKLPPPPEAA